MAISTQKVVEKIKQRHASKYGVDEIKYDFETALENPLIKAIVETPALHDKAIFRLANSPVVRWRIGTKWFYGWVPVKLKRQVKHSFFFGNYEQVKEDYDAMEAKLVKMIEESRDRVAT